MAPRATACHALVTPSHARARHGGFATLGAGNRTPWQLIGLVQLRAPSVGRYAVAEGLRDIHGLALRTPPLIAPHFVDA